MRHALTASVFVCVVFSHTWICRPERRCLVVVLRGHLGGVLFWFVCVINWLTMYVIISVDITYRVDDFGRWLGHSSTRLLTEGSKGPDTLVLLASCTAVRRSLSPSWIRFCLLCAWCCSFIGFDFGLLCLSLSASSVVVAAMMVLTCRAAMRWVFHCLPQLSTWNVCVQSDYVVEVCVVVFRQSTGFVGLFRRCSLLLSSTPS